MEINVEIEYLRLTILLSRMYMEEVRKDMDVKNVW
jgi:hypothetical protein